MNTGTADSERLEKVIPDIVDYMSQDPLCLEIRHYPAANEFAGNEKLHLLIIMQREIKQVERRQYIEQLKEITARQGLDLDVIFSSPKVWRDLTALVGPFTRIEKESVIDWRRENQDRKTA